jgi:hypothetical protein
MGLGDIDKSRNLITLGVIYRFVSTIKLFLNYNFVYLHERDNFFTVYKLIFIIIVIISIVFIVRSIYHISFDLMIKTYL